MKFRTSITAEQVAADILEMTGRDHFNDIAAIVTGGNTGLGKQTAKVLAENGATVAIACRGEDRGQAAEKELRRATGNESVRFLKLDLASFESIRSFADVFKGLDLALNLLINNAGVGIPKYETTADGFEKQFGINHLGHFLLTELLLPELKKNSPYRIVNLASDVHRISPEIDWDRMPPVAEDFRGWRHYGLSKLCNILYTRELQERLTDSSVLAFSVHPGGVKTDLGRHLNPFVRAFFTLLGPFIYKSISEGAATTLFCAVHPDAEKDAGEYFSDCQRSESTELGKNMENARKLTAKSREWCNLE